MLGALQKISRTLRMLTVALAFATILFAAGGTSLVTAHAASQGQVKPAYIQCSSQVWYQKSYNDDGNWNEYWLQTFLFAGYDANNHSIFCGDWYGYSYFSVPAYKTGGNVYSYIIGDGHTTNGESAKLTANDPSAQAGAVYAPSRFSSPKVIGAVCASAAGKVLLTGGAYVYIQTGTICP